MSMVTRFWLWSLLVVCGLLTPAVPAQSPAKPRDTPTQIDGVSVDDVLERLGAQLEKGASPQTLAGYANQFDRTDPNRDGKHTRKEYVDGGRYLTPQARSGIFRAADGNGDGVVTRSEYILNRIITDEAKQIVQRMDDDRNGAVERSEFVKHAGKRLAGREFAAQVFSALDTNDDGSIRTAEYLRVWGQWARSGRPPAEKRIASRQAQAADSPARGPNDTNNAGSGGRRPSRRPDAETGRPSVDEVFARFDANKDGKLQKQEIPAFVQQFILPADADNDDVVTRQELQAARNRQGEPNDGDARQPNRGAPNRRPGDRNRSRSGRPDGNRRFGGQPSRFSGGSLDPRDFVDRALQFDADKDGKLDRTELQKLAESLGRRRERPRDPQQP